MAKDPILAFALLMLVLLVAPALAARLKLPGVVGLIAAGAVLGPSSTGILERTETLQTLGRLGLLYLMFMAGLSLDLQQFAALRQRSLAFGVISFGIPHLLGMAMAWALGLSLLTACMIGAIAGTHTLVALPVAQRLGLSRHPAVTVTAGATIVCDLLGMTVLAAVVALHGGHSGLGFWALFVGKLALFLALALLIVPRLGRWVLRRVPLTPPGELAFLLLVLFGTAYGAELAGLASIVGAFLAGLTLNRMVPTASGLMGRVVFVGDALFIPFFLVGVGMLVDPAVLTKGGLTWAYAVALVGTIWAGKGLAAWLLARRTTGRFGAAGWLVFGLSTPQAAGTLAVTLVGYQLDPPLLKVEMVNAVVVLILVTCVVGPWVVERAGRQAALEEDTEAAPLTEEAPRILIPLANPDTAGALVDLAIVLREPGTADPIHPLTVVRDGPAVHDQVARNERLLGEAVLHAVAAGAPVQPVTRVDLNVVHAMVRAAKELRTSMVVIGWGGEPSAGDRVFGGLLDQLLALCPEMLLVSKTVEPVNTAERVLLVVPRLTDRQEGFRRALHAAKTLARNIDAELRVLAHPDDVSRVEEDLREVRPATPFVVAPLAPIVHDDGEDLVAPLMKEVGEHDVLVLVDARRESLAWGPTLARLPGRLSTAFPARTLIVIHPAHSTTARSLDTTGAGLVVQPTALDIVQSTAALGIGSAAEPAVESTASRPAATIDACLRRLLGPELLTRPDALERVVARLAAGGAQEVGPGVAFFHAHADCWPTARVFTGDCPEGVVVEGDHPPATTVVAVISPWGIPPEVHLRNLAVVARAALSLEPAALRAARTVAELRQALGDSSSGVIDP